MKYKQHLHKTTNTESYNKVTSESKVTIVRCITRDFRMGISTKLPKLYTESYSNVTSECAN